MIISGVYLLIKNHIVVYVGQTMEFDQRLKQHSDKDFDRYHFFACDIDKLNHFEERLIDKFRPIYNKEMGCHYSIEHRRLLLRRRIVKLEKQIALEGCKK